MERTQFYDRVRDRLIRYAKVDTRSDPASAAVPTTAKQFDLARPLRDELTALGASEVWLDEEKCVVYAQLPSTMPGGGGRAVGFVTHMDTSPEASGTDVKPWVLENYDGGDILLNREKDIVMRPEDFPNLRNYVGQDLVLTDGTTLLGGDDKAAIAAVMTLAEHYLAHPELFSGEEAGVFVETQGTVTLGKTVTDLWSDRKFDRKTALVLLKLDRERFVSILKERIASLP